METLSENKQKQIKNPKHHFIWDKIILIILILTGVFLFFVFSYSRSIQIAIISIFLAIYLIWGIIHHRRT
ncbi:MAG: hypothetical protein ACTSYY_12765, partial [Promethearchaeota archaeon]